MPGLPEERLNGLRGPLKLAASLYQTATRVAPLRLGLKAVGPLLSASAVKPKSLGPVR